MRICPGAGISLLVGSHRLAASISVCRNRDRTDGLPVLAGGVGLVLVATDRTDEPQAGALAGLYSLVVEVLLSEDLG